MRLQHAKGLMLTGVAAVALTLSACAGGASPTDGVTSDQGNDAAAAFYEGKTITMVVPYNPGGGFDAYLRTLVPYLEEELPDTTIKVENQPGGGGLIGANSVYNAEPDGLTVGLINYPGAIFAELTETDGVTFENAEWTHYGRLASLPPVLYTRPDSQYTTFEELLDAAEPVTFGIGGVGSDAYYVLVALSNILQFPVDIIGGYPGSAEANGALLAGEVEASVNSGAAGVLMVTDSDAHGLAVVSGEPLAELPDVPLVSEFGDDAQKQLVATLASVYDLERVIVGPPDVPEDRADFLADAIFTAASKSGYAQEMEASSNPVSPLDREDVTSLTEQVNESMASLADLLVE